MISSGSSVITLCIRVLSSTFPGTRAFISMAASRWSSRKSPFRAALSAPWHAKQFSNRIGRISRLYSSFSWAFASPDHSRHRPITLIQIDAGFMLNLPRECS